jgi:hypothetical protein
MINHFRTRVMNLTDNGTLSEYICPGFTAQSLTTYQSDLYALLFPTNTRADIVARMNSYIMLITSCNLSNVFRLYDPRLTYLLQNLYNFTAPSDSLVTTANSVVDSQAANAIVSQAKIPLYSGMYLSSPIKMQRLAGAIAAYGSLLT